ncbi:RDD family protein [Nocardioides sp. BP30]|uniref:RDD family protein n=1 Tax=Nocardioides sp. BP30 TaxID=3036374 RepID=UPI0024688C4F|nr:RDD family protein [Nocardioides sp. BP30]WGL53171.1 RDD family protein [Nocardioides sp. BP30]
MSGPVSGRVVADPDRRFYAWVLDRLIALVGYAAAGVAATFTLFRPGHTLLGVLAIVAVALVIWLVGALMTGLAGVTPGKSLCGLKVVRVRTGEPIGLGPALVRQAIVGLGGYPTLGIGDATLAWMATLDGTGLRRAWHDRVVGSVVLDVRPQPAAPAPPEQAPDRVVNLTALRLVPAEASPQAAPSPAPSPAPSARRSPAPAPVPAAQAPAAAAPIPAAPIPAAPASVPVPPVPPTPAPVPARWRVTFDTGQSFVVEGLALVGRSPEPRQGERAAHLVPLQSSDMSLSKTHAQFGVVPDGTLVVMDRGSTNGSVLLRGGVAKPLTARQPATLLPGDRVRFGDREMTVAREA